MVHIKKKILKRKQWQSFLISFEEHCCYSITKQCLALCNPMDCSTPGFPVLHYHLEFSQTHVHWVTDVIRLSHPLSPSSPPALSLSQPASGSFPMSWLFTSGGQSIGASASAPVRNFDQDPTCNSHQPFLNLPWTPVHSDFASAPDSLSLSCHPSPIPKSPLSSQAIYIFLLFIPKLISTQPDSASLAAISPLSSRLSWDFFRSSYLMLTFTCNESCERTKYTYIGESSHWGNDDAMLLLMIISNSY